MNHVKIQSLIWLLAFTYLFTLRVYAGTPAGNARQSLNQAIIGFDPGRLPTSISLHRDAFRSGTVNILALRVEFIPDTLETTSGEGSFDYSISDTFYFDPPPHDSLYFSDQLEFGRFYWQKMSAGKVDLAWDIYPAGSRAAYQLPKQMWQYNYNYTDEQLDKGLAQLFYDAVHAADQDPEISWQSYDLVIIFHAGAGAEFDLGYTSTPHDIPSAWMVEEDLHLIGVEGGIPVDNGAFRVREGILLPETETHEGVQISMTGVMCSLFGHWLGLPALYDRDSGAAVVGKWSLMDRGFGNFFGAVPGAVDAWSRGYMGWIEPVDILPGEYSVAAFGFPTPDVPEAYRIRIDPNEYFIISCRQSADLENNDEAVTWAYDREDRKMELKLSWREGYMATPDSGFRVPVRIDNLDFDTPGSGILVWHVDESLLPLVAEGRFNSVDELRGLDLEEADGAQDIGQNYPFLTAGWGTDYGVFMDAWYADNSWHQDANEGRLVSFNNRSYPASMTNAGDFTHITIDRFSRRDSLMSFTYSQGSRMYTKSTPVHDLNSSCIGNFDGNISDDEIAILADREIVIYDGSGEILQRISHPYLRPSSKLSGPVVGDINGDDLDEIVWSTDIGTVFNMVVLRSLPLSGYEAHQFFYLDGPGNSVLQNIHLMLVGERGIDSKLMGYYTFQGADGGRFSQLVTFDSDLIRQSGTVPVNEITSLHLYGTEFSDTMLAVCTDGSILEVTIDNAEFIGTVNEIAEPQALSLNTALADFNGNGFQDLLFLVRHENEWSCIIAWDVPLNGLNSIDRSRVNYALGEIDEIIPADVDRDGRYEILAYAGGEIIGLEVNGVLADGFPKRRKNLGNLSDLIDGMLVADLDKDGWFEFTVSELLNSGAAGELQDGGWNSPVLGRIDAFNSFDRRPNGFPFVANGESPAVRFCQLDSLPDLELLCIGTEEMSAYDFGYSLQKTDIWWEQPFRNARHSNAVWEILEPSPLPEAAQSVMPADKCYNWPNPAREQTAFRFFLNYPASITVDIFDITGERVETLHGSGAAHTSNEINWNLAGIPRGGYVAIVEADAQGRKETRMVKVAVVK